ncbi:hypothetical protein [Dyadobacter sp. CY343]|uniref:hypothetical protein n=1 Tax=Dyadobacter sp. CY343 TaxID=2907299 RepID=UPI001F2BE21F|nr:hypothetical protein [Dyadobacter sp. CY343]MCE7063493.1 hypothetical protein [Dyadobacter sp. CY343]
MQLIQVFIPIYDQAGSRFEQRFFDQLKEKLTGRFGGVTIYQRAPATGLWKEGNEAVHDEMVIYEVMAQELDLDFWKSYKADLEMQFQQQQILIRSSEINVIQ